MIRLRWLAAASLSLLLLAGCSAPTVAPERAAGCIPGAGEAPTTGVSFSHATNVEIVGGDDYRVLTVRQPYPGGDLQSVVLLGCDQADPALPAELTDAPVLRTPVDGIFAYSTTQLPMITELGELDRLTGVGSLDLISDETVREHVESGAAVEFGRNFAIDAERVVAESPPVLLTGGEDDPALPALAAAGTPTVGWADYLETGALGQAEWIKVMGALTGNDAEAAAAFEGIEQRYTELAGRVRGAEPTPIVAGQPYQGSWPVPGGDSTAGILFQDAGASWSGERERATGRLPQALESVLAEDGDARIWLADGPWNTTADIAATDPRLTSIAAAGPDGQVWTRDRFLGPTGGNQIYERGVLHPDEILADLTAILHPDLMPGHEFVYYRQVPTG
ncbi:MULTISPECIES: ABC transporter substrate-binding protein [Pseudonocardia]|uniref:Periplasmic binding protein n=2 Tax=Pseudonocardia TaxID=1847 RepID=A0A1Y2N323_PSEAH|nr:MULTISPECIES: ABC transporter substrate-binding protein [Pseudonocardia]OSY41830.1 Periplasmic binding protein [Pseudonocardia autotrophica]TDN71118.1 iron complex transport system substrate-binding protein [Pseudonocardia autotrophica]BBG01788.1 iron ABC transporter substrate-binding protein [Pseudonocardia autotrophica]GEC26263.1 iron ABC transporter substrate-binding protein [Pseudonocardia saturnea]